MGQTARFYFKFVLLSEGKCKTRPALSSSKPGYLKPVLTVKMFYQNLHLRKKKKKKRKEKEKALRKQI